MLNSLTVIIPVLNEVGNISKLTEQLKRFIVNGQVIFVDDGSTDGTREELKKIADEDHKFEIIFTEQRLGHMGSYLRGIEASKSELVAIMDGDLQHPPEKLQDMLNLLMTGSDLVVATRYSGNKLIGNRDKVRGIISRGAEYLLRTLVKECRTVSDPLSGFIGFRKSLNIPINADMKGNKLLPFLIVGNPRLKISYVRYGFKERVSGESKIVNTGLLYIVRFIREIIEIRKAKKKSIIHVTKQS